MSNPSSSSIVGKGIAGIGYLVILTSVQRLSTFVLNQLVLRYLDPALLGLASLHFDLFLATTLFLSREGFRLALSRDQPGLTRQSQSTTWLVLPLWVLVSGFLLLFFFHAPPSALPASYLADYHVALYVYVAAALMELLAEPAYVYAQSLMLYRVRAMVEGVAVALRSVVTLVLIGWRDSAGPQDFAVAQLVYAVALLVGYYGYFWRREGWERGIKRLGISWQSPILETFDWDTLRLIFKFTQQSFIKHLLTEGDRIIMSLVSNFYDQGVYSLVANYGSLAVRLLFLPLEETSRNMFSKLLPNMDSIKKAPVNQDSVSLGFRIFETLLRLLILIGLIFVTFGSSYSFTLLDLLLGSKWSHTEAPSVLSWYTLYVFTMALNGTTEALVMAVASREKITHHNYFMILFFAIFSLSAYFLMQSFGSVGLVLANCINMLCRTTYSSSFIYQYFKKLGKTVRLIDFSPRPGTLAVFIACFVVTKGSQHFLSGRGLKTELLHLAIGIAVGILLMGFIYLYEKRFVSEMRVLLQTRKGDQPTEKAE